ncbi:hypothetical protein [Nitrobacter sp. JJSN]|uniref:hypothetical protein n=1 Tax=Nitrobacter sp. JJSN TaxID=3453033 RepID=UPI003F776D8E
MVIDLLRSRVALEAEILVLRQQINVLQRTVPGDLRSLYGLLIIGHVDRYPRPPGLHHQYARI